MSEFFLALANIFFPNVFETAKALFFFFFLIETGKHFKKALGHMPAVKMDGVSQNFMKLKNGNSWLLN